MMKIIRTMNGSMSGPKQEHMGNVCFMGQLGSSVWPDSQLIAASSSDCASGILLHPRTKAASNVSDPLPAVTLSWTSLTLQQLKQKLHQSLQRATLCSQAAEEADESRGAAERSRALAEARALGCQRDKETAEADRCRMREELTQLRTEVGHRHSETTLTDADALRSQKLPFIHLPPSGAMYQLL